MSTKSDILTQSLIDYINDVKPYHSKFRDVSSQIFFQESFNVNINENFNIDIDFKNHWGRDDKGGYLLTNMSEGALVDKTYILPATVFPRFDNLIQKLGSDHLPVEAIIQKTTDNPSIDGFDITIDTTLENLFGFSGILIFLFDGTSFVQHTPWFSKFGNVIHLIGALFKEPYDVKVVYSITHRYEVPYHQGSNVKVSGTLVGFGPTKDYIVDKSRSFIQFMPGFQPRDEEGVETIDIEIFRSDRLFIAKHDPFSYTPLQDSFNIEIVEPESPIFAVLLVPGKTYTILDLGSTNFVLYGAHTNTIGTTFLATSVGSGTGRVISEESLKLAKDTNTLILGVKYIIVEVGTTYFTQYGSALNIPGAAFVSNINSKINGTGLVLPFNIGITTFNNNQPNTNKATLQNLIIYASALTGDSWTISANNYWSFDVQKTNPLNSVIEKASFKTNFKNNEIGFIIDRTWASYYIASPVDFTGYSIDQDPGSYITYDMSTLGTDGNDPSEFFSNLEITNEHGIVGDTNLLNHPIHFTPFGYVKKDISQGSKYYFEFDTIPAPHTYIEFRVEQEGQYNPWVNTNIEEAAFLTITYVDSGLVETRSLMLKYANVVTAQVNTLRQNIFGNLQYTNPRNPVQMREIKFSPDGLFAYSADGYVSGISIFSADPVTGNLVYINQVIDPTTFILQLIISNDGNFLYALDVTQGAANTIIKIYSRNLVTGALSFISNSTLTGLNFFSMEISPDNNHFYVTSITSNNFVVFNRNSISGLLTQTQSMSFINSGGVSIGNYLIKPTPDGKFLYITSSGLQDLVIITLQNGLYLSHVISNIIYLSNLKLLISPDSKFLYGSNFQDNFNTAGGGGILTYSIGTTGNLTLLSNNNNSAGYQISSTILNDVIITNQGANLNYGIVTYDRTNTGLIERLTHTSNSLGYTSGFVSSPNGKFLYSFSNTAIQILSYSL